MAIGWANRSVAFCFHGMSKSDIPASSGKRLLRGKQRKIQCTFERTSLINKSKQTPYRSLEDYNTWHKAPQIAYMQHGNTQIRVLLMGKFLRVWGSGPWACLFGGLFISKSSDSNKWICHMSRIAIFFSRRATTAAASESEA